MSNAVAVIHKAVILSRLSNGERLRDIAKSYGQQVSTISMALSEDPDYQQALCEYAECKMDEGEDMLLSASDQLNVTRAREYLSHTRWLASRLARDKYGDQPTVAVNVAPSFTVVMASSETRGGSVSVIEGKGVIDE